MLCYPSNAQVFGRNKQLRSIHRTNHSRVRWNQPPQRQDNQICLFPIINMVYWINAQNFMYTRLDLLPRQAWTRNILGFSFSSGQFLGWNISVSVVMDTGTPSVPHIPFLLPWDRMIKMKQSLSLILSCLVIDSVSFFIS